MPDSLKFPLVLVLIAGISGGLLAGVYSGTKDKIDEARMRKVYAAFKEIAEEAETTYKEYEEREIDTKKIKDAKKYYFFKDGKTRYYALKDDGGEVFACAVQIKATGYNKTKPIELIVGVSAESIKVLKVVITFSEETPGLGEKIKAKPAKNTWVGIIRGRKDKTGKALLPKFLKQFKGYDGTSSATAVKIDGISGATISSIAVERAVEKAVNDLKILTKN